jgi:hypothetical protein
MTELLDLACIGSLLFFMWYKLWEHVYYREDDEDV